MDRAPQQLMSDAQRAIPDKECLGSDQQEKYQISHNAPHFSHGRPDQEPVQLNVRNETYHGAQLAEQPCENIRDDQMCNSPNMPDNELGFAIDNQTPDENEMVVDEYTHLNHTAEKEESVLLQDKGIVDPLQDQYQGQPFNAGGRPSLLQGQESLSTTASNHLQPQEIQERVEAHNLNSVAQNSCYQEPMIMKNFVQEPETSQKFPESQSQFLVTQDQQPDLSSQHRDRRENAANAGLDGLMYKQRPHQACNVPVQVVRQDQSALRSHQNYSVINAQQQQQINLSQAEVIRNAIENHYRHAFVICNLRHHSQGLLVRPQYRKYINEIQVKLRQSEPLYQPDPNYMAQQRHISPNTREILVDWMIHIQTLFRLLPETLFISVNIVDRFLSKRQLQEDKFLQLIGSAALLIACKFHEIQPPTLSDFEYVMKEAFTSPEILAAEFQILSVLQFDLNYTAPSVFLENYTRAILMSDPAVLVYTSYLLDLALLKVDFLRYKQSELVVCTLKMALLHVQELSSGETALLSNAERSLREVIRREMMDIRKLNACMEKLNFYNCLEYSQQHPSIRKKYEKTLF